MVYWRRRPVKSVAIVGFGGLNRAVQKSNCLRLSMQCFSYCNVFIF